MECQEELIHIDYNRAKLASGNMNRQIERLKVSPRNIISWCLGFAFFLVSVAAVGAMFAGNFLVVELPLELKPYPRNGWTIKFLLVNISILVFLFCFQALKLSGPTLAAERGLQIHKLR